MMLRRDYEQILTQNIANRSMVESSKQEYEILLQFDLKREKEKNMILEERLKNKETFIQQMKTFQEELTTAYEQCKNQLIVAQQKIDYLQNVEYREYHEQIADLQHILSMKNQQSKRKSVENAKKSMFSSMNGYFGDQDVRDKLTDRRDSKTVSKINTKREGFSGDPFELQVSRQIKKVANFINHFVQMGECYIGQLKEEEKLTKKLKISWKWIKEVVRQWDHLSTKAKEWQQFKSQLAQLYQTDEDVDFSILFQLIRNDRSTNKV